MTKKSAALDLLALAKNINEKSADEDAFFWVQWLLGTARQLDPMVDRHPYYDKLLLADGEESKETKLRRLIEHPGTMTAEREAAVAALDRVRRASDN